MGNDGTFCAPWSLWPRVAGPLSSLTFPSSSLLARKCQHPGEGRLPLVWPPSSAGPGWQPLPLFGRAAVSLLLVFLHFPLGQAQLPNAGMEYKRKSVTEQAEASLLKEERNLTVYFPSPRPCLKTPNCLLDDHASCISSTFFL